MKTQLYKNIDLKNRLMSKHLFIFSFFLILSTSALTAQINLELSADIQICNGTSVEIAPAVLSGGDGNYTFSWSPSIGLSDPTISNPIASPLESTEYTLTVIDGGGLEAMASINITVLSEMIITSNINNVDCTGASTGSISVAIGGGTPVTYSWSGPNGFTSTTAAIVNLSAGVYSITITNENGCEGIASYTVSEPSPLTITGSTIDANCGDNGAIDIFVTGGIPAYSFVWSTGSTVPNINFLSSGTYCVTVVDQNGCAGVECFIIQESPPLEIGIIGMPTEDCDTDFVLEGIINDGTAPYAFIWSIDGVVVSTDDQLSVVDFPSGFSLVELTVTDASGCTVTQVVEINVGVQISLTALPLNCSSGTTTINTEGTVVGPEYEYEWVGPNGFTSNELNIVVSEVGEYTLEVTNTTIEDCSSSRSIEIIDATVDLGSGITVNIYDCNVYRLSAIIPDDYFGTMEFLWTLPDASTAQDISITGNMTGLYTLVTSIPGLNCEYYSSYYVDLESEVCSTLQGYVRFDESMNCVAEDNEEGMQNIIVTATSDDGIFNSITDETGYYRFNLPSDNYTITTELPTPSWIACEESYTVDLSEAGTIEVLNIPLQGEGLCPELSVTLFASILRRCFTNNYYLTVCNEGTETAILPEIVLILDDYIQFNSATIDPTTTNGQQINWTIDEIGIGECVNIFINVTVSCEAELGQTHCSEVFASSYPFCGEADEWSGANLELVSTCDGNDVIFSVKNTGTGDLIETVNYIIIEDGVAMMDASGVLNDLASGNNTEFNFPANGSTYTFMLDQVDNHPYTISVTNSIEGCGTNDNGDFSMGFVNQFSQQTATPASSIFCQENVGSFDPNDKAAIPVGYGPVHYIEPENKINYRIRFQNTGTDTAFTVVVRDTLSEFLDIRTLEPGNSSHDYDLDIFGEKILSFTFNNILLVDSFTNEPASNGFVDFNIRPKLNAPLEEVIENNAAIFFDFNEPVITNTVFHTLGRDFYEIVNWTNLTDVNINLNVFPNPASDRMQLRLEDIPVNGQILRVLDVNGRQVFQSAFMNEEMLVDIQKWPSSWYVIQLFDANGMLLGTGQLMKQ